MSTIHRIFWCAALSCMALSLAGCGNDDDRDETTAGPDAAVSAKAAPGSGPSNPYVKDLPQLERASVEEGKQLQQQFRQIVATDLEKGEAFRLQTVEKARLWGEKISQYVTTNLAGQTIPLKPLEGRPYAFDDWVIVDFPKGPDTLNLLRTKTTLRLTQDLTDQSADVKDFMMGRSIAIYVKAIDLDGNEIPDMKKPSSLSVNRADMVEGKTFELYFNMRSRDVVRLDNFGGFVEITRDEYNAK